MSETIAEGIEDGQRVLTVASINGTPVGTNEKLCFVMVDTGSGKQLCLAVKNYGVDDVLRYKGSVATYDDLPSSTAQVGDVWNVLADGKNYAWTGTDWDDFGGTITISIAAANDVSLSSLVNGDVLVYNSSTQKWENKAGYLKNNATGTNALAIGAGSTATADRAIQIGEGANTAAHTMNVALSDSLNVRLLDSAGKIPSDRYHVMTGTDGIDPGLTGTVPAPTTGDVSKFLKGDGTWDSVPTPTYNSSTNTLEF